MKLILLFLLLFVVGCSIECPDCEPCAECAEPEKVPIREIVTQYINNTITQYVNRTIQVNCSNGSIYNNTYTSGREIIYDCNNSVVTTLIKKLKWYELREVMYVNGTFNRTWKREYDECMGVLNSTMVKIEELL